MTKRVKIITKNYNSETVKPGEVLVPLMFDEDFAKANCVNPECIKTITVAGRQFKVFYVAVPEESAKAIRSSFNLAVNELLGHYNVPNSVSLDQMSDNYEHEPVTAPSPEEKMVEQEEKQETIRMFADLIHNLIDQSPKHGFATLLLLSGSKGADFHKKMHLGHDAANTVRQQAKEFLEVGLANIDMSEVHSKKSKRTEYYREEANRLLDTLLKLYNE